MAPVFSHGDLRLYLLNLLAEGPRHGYDIIQALTDRTGGTYTPSAGTIYPRLAKLEEEGLVTKSTDGRKTVYAITDAGQAEVAARASDLEGIEEELADSIRLIADEVRGSVREAMRSLRADLAAASKAAAWAADAPSADWPASPSATDGDARAHSREQLSRAEALISDFRARVRAEVRTHVARGGALTAAVVDDFERGLDAAAAALTEALRN